jgi:hypothetical protein
MFRRLLGAACAASLTVAALPAVVSAAPEAQLASGAVQFNASDGGDGWRADGHDNLCTKEGLRQGGNKPARIALRVSFGNRGGHDIQVGGHPGANDDGSGTLICSPELQVWGRTAGPGREGFSTGCPRNERPVDGGAGYWASPNPHLIQVHGSFGLHHDGYWHYIFQSLTGHTVDVQFWAVCLDRNFDPQK